MDGKGYSSSEFLITAGFIIVALFIFLSNQEILLGEIEGDTYYSLVVNKERLKYGLISLEGSNFISTSYIPFTVSINLSSKNDGVVLSKKGQSVFLSFPDKSVFLDKEGFYGGAFIYLNYTGDYIISRDNKFCNNDGICQRSECLVGCGDCIEGLGISSDICKNDGVCNEYIGENCANDISCSCYKGYVCSVRNPFSDKKGCVEGNKRDGAVCYDDIECFSGYCDKNSVYGYCCPRGSSWNGRECVVS